MKNKILGLILILAFLTAGYFDRPPTPAEQVYAVCNASRITQDRVATRCGELQNKYKTEFLCRDTDNSTECWTEDHTHEQGWQR